MERSVTPVAPSSESRALILSPCWAAKRFRSRSSDLIALFLCVCLSLCTLVSP
jgi:hypothetical protein